MLKKIAIIIVVGFLLFGCAQQINLGEVDLDSVPFQSGDLPNQYSSGQIVYRWADGLPNNYLPDNIILQKVGWDISEGYSDDYVLVALYESIDDLNSEFLAIANEFDGKIIDPNSVGEKEAFVMISALSGEGLLEFTKCNALVVIRITGADVDLELLEGYGSRIEKRLKPIVCVD